MPLFVGSIPFVDKTPLIYNSYFLYLFNDRWMAGFVIPNFVDLLCSFKMYFQACTFDRFTNNKLRTVFNHGMASAFLGSVFDIHISNHIIEIEQPIDEFYDNQHTGC